MDVIEALPETEPKRDSRGRKVLSVAERERVLAEYDRCGLTQREFCRREGVNDHTFVAWLGQRRKNSERLGGDPTPSASPRQRFVEMVVPFESASAGSGGGGFELDLDAHAWMRDVLAKAPVTADEAGQKALLPYNWKS